MRDIHKKANPPEDYLEALEEWGTLRKATKVTGIPPKMVYEFRKDEAFREREAMSMEIFKESLIDSLVERGRDGIPEPVIYQGKRKYEVDPHTEKLLLDENGVPIPLVTRKPSDPLLVKAIEYFFPESKPVIGVLPGSIKVEIVRSKNAKNA